jgi:ribosomal protein S18 acetylase RimI-like enzyme
MMGKVIQGFFVGGRARSPTPVPQPKAMPRPPGPPVPAFAGRPPMAQACGSDGSFQIDPGQLGLASGGGRPLPDAVRDKMEAALGADFSNVRVHVGPQAERIGAVAFTMGTDIYFAPGRFQPDTLQGRQLLGHELAHVVQQRQGRVRNPKGAGVAVVQDRALESEADRLGHRAAAHRVIAQPKQAHGAVQPSSPVRISTPMSAGPGRYRLTATTGGLQVGEVMVHTKGRTAAEITDLGVDPAHRDHGIGKLLLASAARTGMQFGKSKVTLAAQDDGSGRLTHWYKGIGFAQVGVNERGYPRLEAAVGRLLGAEALRRVTGCIKANNPNSSDKAPVQARGIVVRVVTPGAPPREVIQPMKRGKTKPSVTDKKEGFNRRKAEKNENDKKRMEKEAAARNDRAKIEKEKEKKKEDNRLKSQEQAEKNRQKEALRPPPEVSEEARLKVLLTRVEFRRLESVARLLETPDNICVAITKGADGQIYATTNKASLNQLVYSEETLWVGRNVHPKVVGENHILKRAKKVSAFIRENELVNQINHIQHVCSDQSDGLHAEMKMLNFLAQRLKLTTPTEMFISKVCCANCSRALSFWNAKSKKPKIIYRPESSGSSWPGWECPPCINQSELEEWVNSGPSFGSERVGTEEARGRQPFLTALPTRRASSQSPAPKGAKGLWLES